MKRYDFYRLLEPMEFQNFARDMIQAREDFVLESFSLGGDRGIDGRFVREDGYTVIFQAKWVCGGISKLLYLAREERKKLLRLPRVDRYILVFSEDLCVDGKKRIKELLSPFVLYEQDIVTGGDLNDYLAEDPARYKRVEENYFKLWIENTDVLRRVLFETVNGTLTQRSRLFWEDAVENAKVFVETQIYENALRQLKSSHVLIISGEPGMGKTTLAKQLALYFCLKYDFRSYLAVSTVDELYTTMQIEGKKVLIFDDFWGSNSFEGFGNSRQTRELLDFMEYIQKKKDTLLLMTTREYILEQGLERNESFRRYVQHNKIEVRMKTYDMGDKLRIYFGHLRNSSLTWEQVNALSEIGHSVINSSNYNPRVIADYTRTVTPDMPPDQCVEEFKRYLEYPEDFWKHIFSGLSEEAKRIYLMMAIMPDRAELAFVRKVYDTVLAGMEERLEQKEFTHVIWELEKTVLKTEPLEQGWPDLLGVFFQNPSAGDFILHYISQNLVQCSELLYQSCLHFDQCVEFLELLKKESSGTKLYGRVMERALSLLDFWNNPDEVFKLLQLYQEQSCFFLRNAFSAVWAKALERMKKQAEFFSRYDMSLFPQAAVKAVRVGFSEDKGQLLTLYLNCQMRCRMPLAPGELSSVWKKEWEEYRESNRGIIAEYLKKYFRAELCLAAAEDDTEQFEILFEDWKEALEEYGLKFPEEEKALVEMYFGWLTEKPEEDEKRMEEMLRRARRVAEIYTDFRQNYLREILPRRVEEPEEWIRESELPKTLKEQVLECYENGNVLWDSFWYEEGALEFLLGLAKKRRLSEGIWDAAKLICAYIREECGLTQEELEAVFLRLDEKEGRRRVWSKEELCILFPEFWKWEENKAEKLVEIGAFVRVQQWYRLSSKGLRVSVLLEQIERMTEQERIRFCRKYCETQGEPEEGIRFDADEEMLILEALWERDEGFYREQLLEPAAEAFCEKVRGETEEETLKNLLEELCAEIYLDEGMAQISSIQMDFVFTAAEISGDIRLFELLSQELSKEQLKILRESGFLSEEDEPEHETEIQVLDLEQAGLLSRLHLDELFRKLWQELLLLCKEVRE